MNSVVWPDLLSRTSTAPSVLRFDPSADFGTVATILRLSTDMPSCGKISGWNAVIFAPVSGRNFVFSLLPSMFSTSISTRSSFSGLCADAIVIAPIDADDVLVADAVAFGDLQFVA